MLDSEIMDYIISYWKDDAEMKYMFESGDRVLLGPFTIPVYILCFFQSQFYWKYMYPCSLYLLLTKSLFIVLFFFTQYLLDFSPFKRVDSKGNKLPPRASYDVKSHAKFFKYFVRPNENLLTANLVNSFSFYFWIAISCDLNSAALCVCELLNFGVVYRLLSLISCIITTQFMSWTNTLKVWISLIRGGILVLMLRLLWKGASIMRIVLKL